MLFAYVENSVIARYPAYPMQDFPNTSFPYPMTESALPIGYVIVHETVAPVANSTQVVVETSPALVDGQWSQTWGVEDNVANAT